MGRRVKGIRIELDVLLDIIRTIGQDEPIPDGARAVEADVFFERNDRDDDGGKNVLYLWVADNGFDEVDGIKWAMRPDRAVPMLRTKFAPEVASKLRGSLQLWREEAAKEEAEEYRLNHKERENGTGEKKTTGTGMGLPAGAPSDPGTGIGRVDRGE